MIPEKMLIEISFLAESRCSKFSHSSLQILDDFFVQKENNEIARGKILFI